MRLDLFYIKETPAETTKRAGKEYLHSSTQEMNPVKLNCPTLLSSLVFGVQT